MKNYYLLIWVLLSTILPSYAQPAPNANGLWVINTTKWYQQSILADTSLAMTDVQQLIPSILIDLKYVGTDNFMHTVLYEPTTRTYLRAEAAKALKDAQDLLNKKGLGLKIWDAYRPYRVTEKMWEPIQDERYVANPKYGSGHNRGIAVDVTLVNLTTGKDLDMGTGFDNFSDTAHVSWKDLPVYVLENRALLQQTMEAVGFQILPTEWWHFYLPQTAKYDLLDLTFKQLKKITQASH
jgi:D-alanyl-D-alanine dipeptidase